MHPSSECANHFIFRFQHFLRTAMWGCRWVCCQELVRGGSVLRCSSRGKPHNLSNHKITKVRAWVCPRTGAMGDRQTHQTIFFFRPRSSQGFLIHDSCCQCLGLGTHGFFVALSGDRWPPCNMPGGPHRIGLRALDEVGPTQWFLDTLQVGCWNGWIFHGLFPKCNEHLPLTSSHLSKYQYDQHAEVVESDPGNHLLSSFQAMGSAWRQQRLGRTAPFLYAPGGGLG